MLVLSLTGKPAKGPRRPLPPARLHRRFWWPVSLCFPLWQIFQAQGSYSFLVCGVIFGCLAFTFYVLLLFFHRMHPGCSSGKERICFYTGGKQSRGLLWEMPWILTHHQCCSIPSRMRGNVYFSTASFPLFLLYHIVLKCLEYGWSWEIFFWWSISIRVLFWWKSSLFMKQCLEQDVTADDRTTLKKKWVFSIKLQL